MLFQALPNDRAVLPLLLYIQERLGLWGESYRARYLFVVVAFSITVCIPKLTTTYTNLETFICSMAELVFIGNVFGGAMLLWTEYDSFRQFIEQVNSLTKYFYREDPLKEHVLQFNYLIHRYTNRYCFSVMILIMFYLAAPVITSFVVYFQSLWQYYHLANGTVRTWDISHRPFSLHMEQDFYGLQPRTIILHYTLYIAVIVPMMFVTACTVHMKVLTIASSVRYAEMLLHIVMLKVDSLPKQKSIREELHDIIKVHQRTLDCIALLVKALRPVLLLQLVFCVLIWCLMMLYFTITDGISVKFVNIGIMFLVITIETFSPCYFGTRLSTQAVELSESVYACGWPAMDRDIQQRLRMVLHRTQSPVGIQAGKFCFVDMELFQKMVNKSYSCFIVLQDAL
uniref:Odorant receptor n=1 Tax=Anopheles coluzzii TaxID=1518534 RepID=A0A6E8VYT7_ANOCL